MATKRAVPATRAKKPELLLNTEAFTAYQRMSEHVFLSAENMLRSEKVLKGLVSQKLATMTRCDGVLKFKKLLPTSVDVCERVTETRQEVLDAMAKEFEAAAANGKAAAKSNTSVPPKQPKVSASLVALSKLKQEKSDEEERRAKRAEASARSRAKKRAAA